MCRASAFFMRVFLCSPGVGGGGGPIRKLDGIKHGDLGEGDPRLLTSKPPLANQMFMALPFTKKKKNIFRSGEIRKLIKTHKDKRGEGTVKGNFF